MVVADVPKSAAQNKPDRSERKREEHSSCREASHLFDRPVCPPQSAMLPVGFPPEDRTASSAQPQKVSRPSTVVRRASLSRVSFWIGHSGARFQNSRTSPRCSPILVESPRIQTPFHCSSGSLSRRSARERSTHHGSLLCLMSASNTASFCLVVP